VLGNTSTGYKLEGLIPNTSYTVGIRARDLDALFASDVSTTVEATFTTANVTPTLAAPVYPQWFSGSIGVLRGLPRADGSYGMAVYATVFPGLVEFWQALETSVGSGTYGSFVLVATEPSAQGDWTKFTGIAPHDGLRRQIKARHVSENATASAFTRSAPLRHGEPRRASRCRRSRARSRRPTMDSTRSPRRAPTG
jgi:hypothetical protein